MVAPVRSAGGRARCFCGYDLQIATLPASPRPTDEVRVLCAGVWSDSCVPAYSSHEAYGRLIRVYSVHSLPPGVYCATVLMPFCNAADIGCLPAGTYEVEWYLTEQRYGGWPSLCATGEFRVIERLHTTYLPLLLGGA